MKSVLIALVIAWAVGALLLLIFQERLLYFPIAALDDAPSDIGIAYEEVTLETEDGERLGAWFVPAEEARGAVLFCHGNAGNRSHRLGTISLLHRLGLDVLIFDYRGYAESSGRPTEEGTYRDVAAAWKHLVEVRGIPPSRIVLFGRSLGGAVASWLAPQVDAAGLIVESSFTSVPAMVKQMGVMRLFRPVLRIEYDTLSRIAAVGCPVLIAHGAEDEVVPYAHGRALYEAAVEPKRFLELAGGHNDAMDRSGRTYVEALDGFFDEVLGGEEPR